MVILNINLTYLDISWAGWVKLKCDNNVLVRGLWQNTCQWVSVRSHMWLRFCHWASKHQHIYRNLATYLPVSLPVSTVTQSRCWPLVICKAPFTRYNLLSNRLSNRFDNRVNVCIHDTTGCQNRCQTGCQTRLTTGCIVYTAGCQTGCTTWFDNRLNEQWLFVQHGCQTGCQTGLYNRFDNRVEWTVCSFNTVVKPSLLNRLYNPVWQPVERTVLFVQDGCQCQTGCQTGLYNWFDNRQLFVQHGRQTGCQTRLTTGLTTGWMFVYTIEPVVKPVVQPVWQPALSCKRGLSVIKMWQKRCQWASSAPMFSCQPTSLYIKKISTNTKPDVLCSRQEVTTVRLSTGLGFWVTRNIWNKCDVTYKPFSNAWTKTRNSFTYKLYD